MAPRFIVDETDGIRRCECIVSAPPSWRIRLAQRSRWLLKQTLWTPMTTLLDRLGLTLQTVQVLCIDRAADDGAGRVLLLLTEELDPRGRLLPCAVQGLRAHRHGRMPRRRYDQDSRADARRELLEEAVQAGDGAAVPPLERFDEVARYREGRFGQFDCRLFVVEVDSNAVRLRPETSEGIACWARIDDALASLPASATQARSTEMIRAVLAQRRPPRSSADRDMPRRPVPLPIPGD
jgi:hypothetical protein